MCTATWLLKPNGYQLFFNRDEQKGRPEALPPARFAQDGVEFVMPVDPVGGGSWLAMNEQGLCLCLLNYYQGHMPQQPLVSRGLLVKQLAVATSAEQALFMLGELSLVNYAPFTLMIFEPGLTSIRGHVAGVCWNGVNLTVIEPKAPMVSSAVDVDTVTQHRKDEYQQVLKSVGTTEQALRQFHGSHSPEKGHLSACMHRHDAHTVSFTHIDVTPRYLSMTYRPGALCKKIKKSGNKNGETSFLLIRKPMHVNHEIVFSEECGM